MTHIFKSALGIINMLEPTISNDINLQSIFALQKPFVRKSTTSSHERSSFTQRKREIGRFSINF